jgi:predicted dehydrogenase
MATRQRIGFAVVGLGNIAQTAVLPAFARAKKANLAAAVSRDKNKAARLAKKFGAKTAYGNDEYDLCLRNPAVQAVYIATPQGEHESLAVRAAAAGKHVLCEKPLASNTEQSSQMIVACRRNGVLLMTAYRKYFEPSTLYLKKLISSGALGRIDIIHTGFSELNGTSSSPEWLRNAKLAGGGPLMDLGIYCVNTTRWLIDEDPIEVSAHAWRHDVRRFYEIEEGVAFSMRFKSGIIAEASTTYSSAMSSFITVQGSKGWVILAPAFPFDEERTLMGRVGGRPVSRRFNIVDEFAPELDAFAAAIQSGSKLEADGIQGHRDLEIIRSIYESAQAQRPVIVKYQLPA